MLITKINNYPVALQTHRPLERKVFYGHFFQKGGIFCKKNQTQPVKF